MATMTPAEADRIVDLAASALQVRSPVGVRPKSLLKGHDIVEIYTAMKLVVARQFLEVSLDGDSESMQTFDKGVEMLGGAAVAVYFQFVDDSEIDKLKWMDPESLEYKLAKTRLAASGMKDDSEDYKQWSELETIESFANYCRHLGADDPLYWQKIYTHLGLEYGGSSPSGEVDGEASSEGVESRTQTTLAQGSTGFMNRSTALVLNSLLIAFYIGIAVFAPSPWVMFGSFLGVAVLVRCGTMYWMSRRAGREAGEPLPLAIPLVLLNLILGLLFSAGLVFGMWWLGRFWPSGIKFIVPCIAVFVAFKSTFPLSWPQRTESPNQVGGRF